MRRATIFALVALGLCGAGASGAPLVESYLIEGKLVEGKSKLQKQLAEKEDAEARFGLGVLLFVQAQERLLQDLYRYGFRDSSYVFRLLGDVRPRIPKNPKPERITYDAFRKVVQTWLDGLTQAEASFARLGDNAVELRLHVGRIKLDRTGAGDRQTLFEMLTAWGVTVPGKEDDFVVKFDRGDAAWFRGYCHLLSAVAEIILAHDAKKFFDDNATLVFQKGPGRADPLFDLIRDTPAGDEAEKVQLLAALPALRLTVKEPERLKGALVHLKTMLAQNRLMWKLILAETGDDHEWIPNPRQKSVLGIVVTKEMVDCWLAVLEEIDLILEGKVVLPFWGLEETKGINLNLLFTNPRPIDAALLLERPAAVPFIVAGRRTQVEVWVLLNRVCSGQIFSYSFWFN